MPEPKKRETAHKIRIGELLRGNQIYEESLTINKRLKFIELGNRQIVRINIIANVVDRYFSDGETRFASLTLDDGTGQIRARVFGEDINKFEEIVQGDTLLVIGVLRVFNQELYILPEILKKIDPRYLLIRKLEIEKSYKNLPEIRPKEKILVLREEIIGIIKENEDNEGIDKDKIILKIKAQPGLVDQELQRLIEEGVIYEPRPGRVRYLG